MHYLAAYLFLYFIARTGQVKPALYDGAQVWKSTIRTSSDIIVIKQLMHSQDLSVWHLSPEEAIYLVRAERKLKVHRLLRSRGLNHTVLVMDVQRRVDEQRVEAPLWDQHALRRGHRMDWTKYPTVEVIDEYLDYLANQYPSICKLEIIGHSTQNRTLKMIKVSNGNPSNKVFLVVAGQHAREWMPITSALLILREIVAKFDDQPKFIQDKDWYIIPLINPDGYHHAYSRDRFWRKNRRRIKSCYGVDLNRNYETNFNITGISEHNECSESFTGPYPFSEPETAALRNTTLKVKRRLSAVMDLHLFGQMILFPWSGVPQRTPDFELHNTTGAGMYKAMLAFKNYRYSFGQTYQHIYPASGSLIDWAYSLGARHAYVVEGRDLGQHGFLMPPHYIEEAGQEMLIAVKHVASVTEQRESQEKRESVKQSHRSSRWF